MGEDIEVDHCDDGWKIIDNLYFDSNPSLYRIKPSPREFWIPKILTDRPIVEITTAFCEKPNDHYIKVREVLE